MVVAQDGRRIVGIVTLYVEQKVGKRTAYIEDVVVDGAYRGRGLGKQLMNALIAAARAQKVSSLHLTSNPKREAANLLYKKLGFTLRETNVYSKAL
jgi:ribosomal protein S18 acetylase RimI-like enzyme